MPLETIEIETAPNPEIAVIWLHGLGASANDFVPMVPELDLSHVGLSIRFIFPNAPVMPITVNGGYKMRAWYDIRGTDLLHREDEKGLRMSVLEIETLIAQEKARGIPSTRIFLAGFSQGCAMTLMAGLRHAERLAGLVCLSGYLPLADTTMIESSKANADVPIFMAHGKVDPVVPMARATEARKLLEQHGYAVEWHEYLMPHSVCPQEIMDLGLWFQRAIAACKAA